MDTIPFDLPSDVLEYLYDLIVRYGSSTFDVAEEGFVLHLPKSLFSPDDLAATSDVIQFDGEVTGASFSRRDLGVYMSASVNLSPVLPTDKSDTFTPIETHDVSNHPDHRSWVHSIDTNGVAQIMLYMGHFTRYRINDALLPKSLGSEMKGVLLTFTHYPN